MQLSSSVRISYILQSKYENFPTVTQVENRSYLHILYKALMFTVIDSSFDILKLDGTFPASDNLPPFVYILSLNIC